MGIFMVVRGFSKPFAYAKRYREIVGVLFKYGFGFFLKKLKLHSLLPFSKRIMQSKFGAEASMSEAVRIRMVLEELGVVAIKFGQFLSTRPDIIPVGLVKELEKLQDSVPTANEESMKKQVETELNASIEDVFDWFDEKPLASASIGQVYKARLKTGETVVVKVQRHGLEEAIKTDLAILRDLAKLLEKHVSSTKLYNPTGLVDEFSYSLMHELDYKREARNAELFRRNFEKIDYAYFPQVFWDCTTKRVLTMEYVEGVKITDFDKIDKLKLDKKIIAENGAKVFMKQVLLDGFFHADPHPGNIFVTRKEMLTFMDFGITGFLDKETKQKLVHLFQAVIKKDVDKTVECTLNIMEVEDKTNVKGFKRDISELMNQYYGASLKQIEVSTILNEIIALSNMYHVRIPPNLLLLSKTLLNIEGTGRQLDPEFNLVETAKPFIKQLLKKRFSPKRISDAIVENFFELGEFAFVLPKKLNTIFQRIEAGKLRIDFEHKGLEELIAGIDKSSNRITVALIISATIVGSSLIVSLDKGPMLSGMPLMGLAGFGLAGLLGILLVISILRSGHI